MTGSGALLMVAKCNGSDPSSLAAAFPSFEGSASHLFTKKLEQLLQRCAVAWCPREPSLAVLDAKWNLREHSRKEQDLLHLRVTSGSRFRPGPESVEPDPSCVVRTWTVPIEDALASTGLATIVSSVTARQSLLVDRIATRPILEPRREAERLPGSTRRRATGGNA
jgi:hypothetical protein